MTTTNHMNRRTLRRIAVALCLGLTLSACQSSDTRQTSMSTTDATAAPASLQAATQPVCLGRFILDLPARFVRTGDGDYEYDFITIPKPEPISLEEFEKRLNQLETKLKTTKHDKDPVLLRKSASPAPHSHIYMYWEDGTAAGVLNVDGYTWVGGQQFLLRDEVGDDKQDLAIPAMQAPLTHLRPRDETDIPSDPGFCFNGGFIANAEWKVEKVLAGFDLAQHPDVTISIQFFPLSKNRQDKPLLDRVDNAVMSAVNLFSSMHTLRKGERTIGGFKGQEYLVTAPNDSKQRAHKFVWETQGGGTLQTPFISIEMTSANRDDDGNPRKASITDEQALKLWDSIVSTFRVRPTSAPPAKVSEAPAPLIPLGDLQATGRICPQSGWWQCSEEGLPVKEGRRQFIRSGDAMPKVTLLAQPSWVDRLKGQQPEHRVATVWKLMEYEQASQPSMQGADSPDVQAVASASGADGHVGDGAVRSDDQEQDAPPSVG